MGALQTQATNHDYRFFIMGRLSILGCAIDRDFFQSPDYDGVGWWEVNSAQLAVPTKSRLYLFLFLFFTVLFGS